VSISIRQLAPTFCRRGAGHLKPVRQRLVRRHPVSGRKSLFLSAHAGGIEGMSLPQARLPLMDLTEFATSERFVYVHVWRVNDLAMWNCHCEEPEPAWQSRSVGVHPARDCHAAHCPGRKDAQSTPRCFAARP
jgi:hypothetical protein